MIPDYIVLKLHVIQVLMTTVNIVTEFLFRQINNSQVLTFLTLNIISVMFIIFIVFRGMFIHKELNLLIYCLVKQGYRKH